MYASLESGNLRLSREASGASAVRKAVYGCKPGVFNGHHTAALRQLQVGTATVLKKGSEWIWDFRVGISDADYQLLTVKKM